MNTGIYEPVSASPEGKGLELERRCYEYLSVSEQQGL
jgi:hypothetical protein